MKNSILAGLIIGSLGLGMVISGCQQTTEVPSVLKVLSVSPALDAADVSSTEALSITFNYPIKNNGMTKENFFTEYAEFISGSHDAGTPEVTNLQWSNENRTMTLTVNGWSNLGKGSGNNRVAIRATNRIEDIFGNTLGTDAVLWRFRLRLSQPQADPPTIVLSSGSYEANTVLVTIEAVDADAIHYTDDGSTPTTLSTTYTAPISLENSKVIKAIAVRSGYSNSDVAEAWYDLYWWQALGSGFGAMDEVYAMAYDPDRGILYAAGRFTSAGGVPANNIAQWNGSAWSAVDGGVESTAEVDTLLYANGDLYVGGDFKTADTVTVNGIAKWDGSSWSALGSGVSGITFEVVFDLAFDSSNNLIVGGDFTSPANYIAKWNSPTWSAFSTEPNQRVSNLAYDAGNSILYAEGWFNNIGTNHLAQWNGSAWTGLGTGIYHTDFPADMLALVADSGNLYVGGTFNRAGSQTVSNIAMWNGTAWSALGSGTNDSIYALAYDSSRNILYVGGRFSSPSSLLAKWSGSSWSSIPGSITGTYIGAMTVDPEGNLYIAGNITQVSGITVNRIAKWGKK